MKTSPKTTVALLAILALGGSAAGSLFATSLQTNVISTIDTAGIFFPNAVLDNPAQQVVATAKPTKSQAPQGVVAQAIEPKAVVPVGVTETQIRAITSQETASPAPTADPTVTPEPVASPEATITPSPTPEPSPEVSASQLPEPTFEPSMAPLPSE